ncbi:MAG: hypothetical protein ACD_79C00682G0005 [uncultured bacterium]|nr:MAG: hypothetical protein ACD_79C00682G0005 [uncultured bacterium]
MEYEEKIYAIKELPNQELATKEYENLRMMEKKILPCVTPVGNAKLHIPGAEIPDVSILITVFLDSSLPYRSLFIKPGMDRYRERLLDSIACLLVRLHLAGVFWGDCSLSNILFRREAGELGAYVVDMETSIIYENISDGRRNEDIEIMKENVFGDLTDLALEYSILENVNIEELVKSISTRYNNLWDEINREVVINKNERYKIHERIKVLNNMGFSVDEIELENAGEQDKLKMRALVTDQSYHRHVLHSLTGIAAKDNESRVMLNDIKELRATLCQKLNRSVPMSVAAYQWLNDVFSPSVDQILKKHSSSLDVANIYCQLLEHKWFLSEKAGRDVGLNNTIKDFIENVDPDKIQIE